MKTHIARIGLVVLLALAFSHAAQAAEEIVIDNKEAQTKGNWQKSTGSIQKYKEDYLFSSSTDTPEPNSTAEFRPKIPAAGRYDIDIWYTSGDNRSVTAPVVVSCKSGLQTFKVDEKKAGGKWISVAKNQEFDAGTAGFILIGNNTGSTGSVVVADAIRLVQVSGGGSGYTLSFSPVTGGNLVKEPNQSTFAPGANVQITAVGDAGYVFNGWTGDATGMANPLTVTMNKDTVIGATFITGGIGVIMECAEADFAGSWEDGNKQWGKPHSDLFRWTSGGKGTTKKASATYTPDLPRAGLYDVYVWYVAGANRSETAPFEITSKAGKQVVRLNQKTGGNDWTLLAAGKEFEAGKKGSVRLFNDVEEQTSVVVADAVAFVYVGGSNNSQTVQR